MTHSVLIRPIITERSMEQASRGWYTFAVAKTADKSKIARAVEMQFHVTVTDIKTIAIPAKSKKTGRRRIEMHSPRGKKAIVQLKKDQKIDLFSVPESTQK